MGNKMKCIQHDKLIFVFGSNLAGRHGKGAAAHARKWFGATPGQGMGLKVRVISI